MDDFKKQIEAYRQAVGGDKCPLSDSELNRAIRHATWQKSQPMPAATPRRRDRRWAWSAAAACVLAVAVPLTIKITTNANPTAEPSLIFTCNNGCDSRMVIARLDNIIN